MRTLLLFSGMLAIGAAALSTLLQSESQAAPAAHPGLPELPHFAPKAKSVIWYFMLGGTSHLESFDPKPAVNQHAGKTIDESPYKSAVLDSPFYRKNVRDFAGTPRALMAQLYPMQIGHRKRGQSGIEVSEIFPNVARCVDDLCVIRSMQADVPNHEPSLLLMNCGDSRLVRPSLGSWVTYGLGSESEDLPGFVVMTSDTPGGRSPQPISTRQWHSGFLPSRFQGVRLSSRRGCADRTADYQNGDRRGSENLAEHVLFLSVVTYSPWYRSRTWARSRWFRGPLG